MIIHANYAVVSEYCIYPEAMSSSHFNTNVQTISFGCLIAGVCLYLTGNFWSSPSQAAVESIQLKMDRQYSELFSLYQHLHANPELFFHEGRTAGRISDELESIGFKVTRSIGGYGIVGVLENGSGPTVLLRTDLDALPVREQTGLPCTSRVTTRDELDNEVPVMHACGHDIHMTSFVGSHECCRTSRMIGREHWS
jgi:hypothetical protein